MSFQSQLAADLGVFWNSAEFAESATYTTLAGATSTVEAVLDPGQALSEGSPGQSAVGTCFVKSSQVATPVRYETLTMGGTTWRIDDIISGDGYSWILSVSTDHRAMPRGQV